MRRCAMDEPAIRIESLSKTYAGGELALNDVSFDVPRGQIFGLLGPNGAPTVNSASQTKGKN